MALYDDAKIMFLASAAAGKETDNASKVYNVKPAPVVSSGGSQDISTFGVSGVTDSANSISVSGGVATFVGDGSEFTTLSKNSMFEDGKNYKIVATVSITSGAVKFQSGGGSDNENIGVATSSGTFTFFFAAAASGQNAQFLIARREAETSGGARDKPFNFTVSDLSFFEVDTVPADFTISRTDNLNQTRVGPTGLIEKGRENKFLYSNNFSKNIGTWNHSGLSSVIGIHNDLGQEGYDGTNNATYIRSETNDGIHKVLLSAQAGVSLDSTAIQTISIHAKPLGYTFLKIGTENAAQEAYFDLENGTVGTIGSDVIDAKITPAGNGYFRCSMTVNADQAINRIDFNIALEDNNDSFTGDPNRGGTNNGGIFIQDAQWELGLVPTEIISSNGSAGTAGLKEDEPRFDYPVAGGPPSLLLEPQGKNELSFSEYFEGWASTSGATLTSNDAISPEGVKNATKLLATAGDFNHQVNGESLTVSSGAVSASIFAKKGNTDVVRLRLNGTSNQVRAWFDLENGTTSVDANGTSTITEMNNGWFRCTVTEAGNTNTSVSLQVFINESLSQTTFAADGDEFIYIYGAQLEEGAFATSYIPTHGATATRSVDNVDALDTSGFSFGTTCTIFFEGVINEVPASFIRPITMFNSHASPAIAERFLLFAGSFSSGTYTLTSRHNTGTATVNVSRSSLTVGAKVKCVSVFNGTSSKFFVNGVSGGSDFSPSSGTNTITAASVFNSLDLLQASTDSNHTVGSVILWGSALTDQQCIDLTTL